MATLIDTCGLSCPQPVLMFLTAAKKQPEGPFSVLVDNEASRENVTRAARNSGFSVTESEENGFWRLEIARQAYAAAGVRDPRAREFCMVAAYNMGPNRFLRLYGKTMEEAVDYINSMSVEAFYQDLATRLPARETRYYVARVQRMKAQYASLR